MARLTAAERAQFEAQGYLAPIDALGPDEAAECRRRLEALLAPIGGRSDARVRNSPHLLLRWMADLVRDARVLDPVEDLLGSDLLVLRSTLFVKAPRDLGVVAWHQDVAFWDLSSDRTVTAWIALTDSSVANGCMRVVPGSHREVVLRHRLGRDPNNRLLRGQMAQADISPKEVAAVELRQGQFSLHHGRLLHSSPANPSDTLRAGLAVRFISPDTRQRGPRPSATLVRGVDVYGYYDHEPTPLVDDDPAASACHARALRRYALHVAWQALRRPTPGHLHLLVRLALRADALRAMLPRRRDRRRA